MEDLSDYAEDIFQEITGEITLYDLFENILQQENPKLKDCKGIKVVNETSMRKVNRLFQTQMGMRTLDNLVMRTSHYLDCPIIVAPSVLE